MWAYFTHKHRKIALKKALVSMWRPSDSDFLWQGTTELQESFEAILKRIEIVYFPLRYLPYSHRADMVVSLPVANLHWNVFKQTVSIF